MLRATALYRNVSETAEELSFEPGDQLVVLEQDVGGAVGWWLCSLHGRTGIVPGNRVRLNGGSIPGNRLRMDCSPPVTPGSRFSSGRHCSPQDQVIVPHKSGNAYVYDSLRYPNNDYDIPPSRYNALSNGTPNRLSPVIDTSGDVTTAFSHSNDIYDIPPASWNSQRTGELLYDVPPSLCGFESDKISLSNRSSVLSTMSVDSRSSMASGRSGSSPAMSSRSSVDVGVSNEIYDIPRLSADRSVAPPSRMPPLCPSYSFGQDRNSFPDDNSLAKEDTSCHLDRDARTSTPRGEDEVYDTPKSFIARTEYDNPVYDIPPASSVEKTSSISLNKPSSSDSGLYDELRSGASRQLTALRDSVLVAADKLLRMVSDPDRLPVRNRDSHQPNAVTSFSSELIVQTSLKELIQFGEEIAKQETDPVRSEEIRQRCDKLNRVLVRTVDQLVQLSAPRTMESCSQHDADLVDSLTVIRTTVSELYSLLTKQSAVPTSVSNASSLTELQTVCVGSPRSMVGRGLPPPPVMPKPSKSAPPAKFDISERPLPALPSECPTEIISNSGKKNATVFGDKTATDYDYVLIVDESDRKNLSTSAETSLPVGGSSPADGGSPADRDALHRRHGQPVVNGHSISLNQSDRELMRFYEAQVRAHASIVDAAVSDFCQYASSPGGHAQMSPDVFVQRGKLVVLAAHKLVYIGDSVARHVGDATVGGHVAAAANELCDQLKVVVTATKEAALLSPHNAVLRLRAVESVKAAAEACVTLSKVMSSFVA